MSLHCMRTAGSSLPLLGLVSMVSLLVHTDAAVGQSPFELRKIISNPGPVSAADQKVLDSFLKSQIFGPFTKASQAANFPGIRKNFTNITRGVDKTPGHDFLVRKALVYAEFFISDRGKRFGAPGQYNAMLLLGDLNENDAANKVKPLPAAFKDLKKIVDLPPDSDLAFLKPAALIGITRFAELGAIPQNDMPGIIESLLKMVKTADPPDGRSASAHNYMRRGAARALAAIGNPGPNNDVLNAFAEIAGDPNAKMTLRCEMSQFIGELKIPPDAKIDFKSLANTIGHQTVDICKQEIARAEAEKRDPSRRILMYALYSGGIGLSGLASAAEKSPEASKFISGVRSKTGALYKKLDDFDKTPDDQIEETALPEIEGIANMLLAKPAAPAPMVAHGPSDGAARPAATN